MWQWNEKTETDATGILKGKQEKKVQQIKEVKDDFKKKDKVTQIEKRRVVWQ